MGWHGVYGKTDFRDLYMENYGNITKALVIKGDVGYAAVEHEGHTLAAVILFEQTDRDTRYKFMDETVGPYYYDCPKEILDLLSPPMNDYAALWRAKVEAKNKADTILQRKGN